jgi:hypothetical protein
VIVNSDGHILQSVIRSMLEIRNAFQQHLELAMIVIDIRIRVQRSILRGRFQKLMNKAKHAPCLGATACLFHEQ